MSGEQALGVHIIVFRKRTEISGVSLKVSMPPSNGSKTRRNCVGPTLGSRKFTHWLFTGYDVVTVRLARLTVLQTIFEKPLNPPRLVESFEFDRQAGTLPRTIAEDSVLVLRPTSGRA